MTGLNLGRRAARAAEEFDNRWTKDATNVELRSLVGDAREADSKTLDPVMTRRVRARIDTRRRLGLPHVDCTARRPGDCRCLTAALTELEVFASPGLAEVSKRELLARSSAIHKASKPNSLRLRPRKPKAVALPPEALTTPQAPSVDAAAPPSPAKALTTQTSTKPGPRWGGSGLEQDDPRAWYSQKHRRSRSVWDRIF